ncbi:hypothetical protein C2S52_001916 [Perilla frutescens var. hirtella]|nr:hypothetical protein C2S52_001916 [Perilla frutescens var. hirtella]
MYIAAIEDDWAAAEKLLKEDPTLAYQERKKFLPGQPKKGRPLSNGYGPLHVAVALKHNKFALKLIERMEASYLKFKDANGLTACCHAAASGSLDIAQVMIKKNPKLLEDSIELISLAILSGKSEVVSFLLEQIEVDRLDEYEWLQLLQNAIGTKMNGRQDREEMPPDFYSLAKKLLAKIQNEPGALELLNDPPILHDAAKVGNIELIHMLTHAYPDLIWQTDEKGRSLFNIAIEHREANVFSFIQQFGALNYNFMFQMDKDESNLLHLAANLGTRKNAIPALQMQSELAWYKAVESMLPIQLIEHKNKDKKKPRELFVEKHEELLKESKDWMKSTADSCMLIATIILTVAYATAFTVPGGNNGETGFPVLVNRKGVARQILSSFDLCDTSLSHLRSV